jgi:hypothetical protein
VERDIFGRISKKSNESLNKLIVVLSHTHSAITLRYLGITKEEIADIYEGFNFKL